MSLASSPSEQDLLPSSRYAAGPEAYFALLKPRVMSLVIITALAGMLISPVRPHPIIGFAALLAIAVGAGASGALNMWWDADIDAKMARTRLRPIPSGLIAPKEVLFFGLTLALLSVALLSVVSNFLAGGLLAFTIFFYIVIYSMWLKRSTPQNIVIGGAAGALPPIIGYAAAGGGLSVDSVILFAIIFFWTPPHFWALALVKSADYERVGVPMMPNAKGQARTRTEILVYTFIVAPLALAPYFAGFAGSVYLVVSVVGGIGMILDALRVFRVREGVGANKAAMRLFGFSILYLFALFVVLVVEHGIGLFARWGL